MRLATRPYLAFGHWFWAPCPAPLKAKIPTWRPPLTAPAGTLGLAMDSANQSAGGHSFRFCK